MKAYSSHKDWDAVGKYVLKFKEIVFLFFYVSFMHPSNRKRKKIANWHGRVKESEEIDRWK